MLHQTLLLQLLCVAAVLSSAVQAASSGDSLSPGSPAVRGVLQSDETSTLLAKRGSLVDVLHEVRDALQPTENIESLIKSSTAHEIEKRRKKPSSSNGNSSNTNSTQDDDESGANSSAFTMHFSFAISFAVLVGFLHM